MGGMGGGYGGGGFGGGGYGGGRFGGGMMSGMGGGGYGGGMMGGGLMGSSYGQRRFRGNSGFGGDGAVLDAAGVPVAGDATPDFSRPVSVTADPATNALVISAAPQDWEVLRNIIAELDIPRIQVFVQAIIVEVSCGAPRDIGVNFSARPTPFRNAVGGHLNFGNLQNALGNPLGMTGLGLGLASGSVCAIPVARRGSTALTTTTTTASSMMVPCDVALVTAIGIGYPCQRAIGADTADQQQHRSHHRGGRKPAICRIIGSQCRPARADFQ